MKTNRKWQAQRKKRENIEKTGNGKKKGRISEERKERIKE